MSHAFYKQQSPGNSTTEVEVNHIWELLQEVPDPEVPVLSIIDLGIVRHVEMEDSPEGSGKKLIVTITPTYSGCPAMDVIAMTTRVALMKHGYKNVQVKTVLSPAWTTEWMSEAGKQKLKAYGIAPPNPQQNTCHPTAFQADEAVQCPRCNSWSTKLVSQFGSTACKAFYQCNECLEPFDYFKCH